jgi:hypothetical protein
MPGVVAAAVTAGGSEFDLPLRQRQLLLREVTLQLLHRDPIARDD